jgi:hypothetical protein
MQPVFRAIAMCIIVAIFTSSGFADQPQPTDLFSDLLAAYSFSDSTHFTRDGKMHVRDLTSAGNDLEGSASFTAGKFDQACEFKGDDQYLDIEHANAVNPKNALTVAAWVRGGEDRIESIIDKGDWKNRGARGFGLRLIKGKPVMTIGCKKWYNAESPSTLPKDKWVHLVGTFDGQVATLYVNGKMTQVKVVGTAMEPSPTALRIGNASYEPGKDRGFRGAIDEVLIFNRALSQSEVAELYRRLSTDGLETVLHPPMVVTGANPEPPSTTTTSTTSAVVDLKALIDPKRDAVRGTWTMSKDGLTSDGGASSTIGIPVTLPEEFDFRVEFEREDARPDGVVAQIVSVPGRKFAWEMGIRKNTVMGFASIGGKSSVENVTTAKGRALPPPGQMCTSVVQVRRDSIAAYVDGALVSRYRTDGSDLSLPSGWSGGSNSLALGTWKGQTTFHKIELIPVNSSTTDQADATASTSDPNAIEQPEYRDRAKRIDKAQATIRALSVHELEDGELVGEVTDIIATLGRDSKHADGTVWIYGDVGKAMAASIGEAERAVRVRYPSWTGGYVEFSFQNRGDKHDGPSAGAGFGMLLLSLLDKVDLDPDVAVTGDLTVDWKVRPVGGLAAKVRGAQLDKVDYVLIPSANAGTIDDMALLYSDDMLWNVQVFSMQTLQEGIALARVDRDSKITEAMKKFADLRDQRAKLPRTPAGNQLLQKGLSEVLELAPNHLSAKHLLAVAKNTAPKTLSTNAALAQFFVAANPFADILFGKPKDWPARSAAINARAIVKDIRPKVDRDMQALLSNFMDFVEACDRVSAGGGSVASVEKARDSVRNKLAEMRTNRETMEKLVREGW